MQTTLNRRQWLASSALAAAALALTRDRAFAATGSSRPAFVKLDQNENPYGISKATAQAITEAITTSNRYPGAQTAALRNAIAERENVPPDCVVLGAGSTEIFSLACLLDAADGKEVLLAEPTYSGFVSYAERLRATLTRVPVNERWELNLDELTRRAPKSVGLVYVCNPNNPTGTIVDGARLRQFCEAMAPRGLVFVDEAYHELVEDPRHASMIERVRQGGNVMVARTFSKLYGLAGLRIGYGIARPDLAAQLRRIQTNFAPVSQLSLAAARAAYADSDFIALCKRRNAAARTGFYALLDRLGHKAILGSQTNFVTFEASGGSPALVARLQREFDIHVRSFQFLDRSWVRVSMGTPEEMATLASAMEKLA